MNGIVGGMLRGGTIEVYFKVFKFQRFTQAVKTVKIEKIFSRTHI
jgi:hypothetical protein